MSTTIVGTTPRRPGGFAAEAGVKGPGEASSRICLCAPHLATLSLAPAAKAAEQRRRSSRARSSCDTAAMQSFWRRLLRADAPRASAVAVGLVLALGLGAFLFAAFESNPGPGAFVAAAALVAVAGTGLLYAWRLGPGGLGD